MMTSFPVNSNYLFAYINAHLLKGKMEGIVIDFHGLNGGTRILREDPEAEIVKYQLRDGLRYTGGGIKIFDLRWSEVYDVAACNCV